METAALECYRCGAFDVPVVTEQYFANGKKHFKASCSRCKEFIKYLPTVLDEDFQMPFGKYKGVSLTEIARVDKEYLRWLVSQASMNVRLKERCKNILSSNNPEHISTITKRVLEKKR